MDPVSTVRSYRPVINSETPIIVQAVVSGVTETFAFCKGRTEYIYIEVEIDLGGQLQPKVKVLVPGSAMERVMSSQMRSITLKHMPNGTQIFAIDFGSDVGIIRCWPA